MADATQTGDLFPRSDDPDAAEIINDRCLIRTRHAQRLVIVSGIVLAQYAVEDRMAEAHAMVSLVEQGWADQNDVARAFACSARTLRRHQQRFEDGGLAALGRSGGYPKGRSRRPGLRGRRVGELKAKGFSNREIARCLGVSEMAIRKVLRRLGWKEPAPDQRKLPFRDTGANPNLSAFSPSDESVVPTMDTDPSDRRFDRLMAFLGRLDDAEPLFRPGSRVPGAGVLLAIPALLSSGVLDCAREIYGTIGPAFYGLRTTMVTLVLMALLRIKRPEGLKEHPPDDLGRILGLDRAPEVKTLRRKLTRLAGFGHAARGAALGFLYVDGHVRVYHGKRNLPKAHVTQMRLSMPATTDYWANDARGEPLFVVTAEANAGLVAMLPAVLQEVRSLVGERRVTVVFDRGGWSPKLFGTLIAAGFDVLTYRKGRFPRRSVLSFRKHTGRIDGRQVSYSLADQGVHLLGGKLRLRQVTRLSDNGHQTPIITSRRDLSALEVAYRMFARWRQENFFKYLSEEYALDALVDDATEPADPHREVPNPRWKELDTRLREARVALMRLPAEYGLRAFLNSEKQRPTMRGFTIAHGTLGKKILAAAQRCRTLMIRRASVPTRVPVAKVVAGPVVKLAAERKHLTSLLKMVAYQTESDLVQRVIPHYRRAEDEGRTLIQSALASPADIEVTKTELRVTLAPLSSPHRTRAIAALCEQLTAMSAVFPGTKLRLRCDVAPTEIRTKADKS